MRQEPSVLEFSADGKLLASNLSSRSAKNNAAQSPAQPRDALGWRVGLLVAMAVYLVHAVCPCFEAAAESAVADTSGLSSGRAFGQTFVQDGALAQSGAPAATPAASSKEKTASGKPKERAFHGALPQSVSDMREQIQAAIVAGNVSDLKDAIEWNEIKPDFGKQANADPIAYWKTLSSDGEGREVLAILANLLALPPARLAIGKDPENTLVYVWPYLAELPLDQLKPSEEVDLYRLLPAAQAKKMREGKTWTWWRLAIGADGTWHTFRKYD